MQTSEDPFGDGPFRAISSVQNVPTQVPIVESSPSFQNGINNSETPISTSQNTETASNFGFGNTDILADILPPSGPSPTGFPAQMMQPTSQLGFASHSGPPPVHTGFQGQPDQYSSLAGYPPHLGQASSPAAFPAQGQVGVQTSFPLQSGQPGSFTSFQSQMGSTQTSSFAAPSQPSLPGANFNGNSGHQSGSAVPALQPMPPQRFAGAPANYNHMNSQYNLQTTSQMQQAGTTSTDSLAIVPQPANDKFQTKSTVWADTLNRGLVNLNISGCKLDMMRIIFFVFRLLVNSLLSRYLMSLLSLFQPKQILWLILVWILMPLIEKRRGWKNLVKNLLYQLLTWVKLWVLVLELAGQVQMLFEVHQAQW